MGALRREALEAFHRNFPFSLEAQPREKTHIPQGSTDAGTYAVVADGGEVVAWVDIFGDDVDVEWTPNNNVRVGERDKVEERVRDAVRISRAPDNVELEDDEHEVEESEAVRSTVATQVELVEARTRHLRERTPPAGSELDAFRRAIAPIQRDLADPQDDRTRSPQGIIAKLQAARLGGEAHKVAVFLRGSEKQNLDDLIDGLTDGFLDAQATVTVEDTNNGTVLLPYEALRGREQDFFLAAGAAARGQPRPLRHFKVPPDGREEAFGYRISGPAGRELAEQLNGAVVYHANESAEELQELHQALTDLREWLARAPPRLEAVRRGLAVAVALLDTWGCRSRERDDLLVDLRDSWQAFDSARTLFVLADAPGREDAAKLAERRMLQLLRRAQDCAEGQQGLDFSAPVRTPTDVSEVLRVSIWADSLPKTLTIREQVFARPDSQMDDDEVTVRYTGETTGTDKRPGALRLHLRPVDQQRLQLAAEIVDGAERVVGSFPWRTVGKYCLADMSGSWLTPMLFGSLPSTVDDYGELTVPIAEQDPAALRQLAAVVAELRRDFFVRPIRSGMNCRVVELASKGTGHFVTILEGTPLAKFTITAPPVPPALGDLDREPLREFFREAGRSDAERREITTRLIFEIATAFQRASRRYGGTPD